MVVLNVAAAINRIAAISRSTLDFNSMDHQQGRNESLPTNHIGRVVASRVHYLTSLSRRSSLI